jgi:hypothetical protein
MTFKKSNVFEMTFQKITYKNVAKFKSSIPLFAAVLNLRVIFGVSQFLGRTKTN